MRWSLPRSHDPELMDRPDNSESDLAQALRDIGAVNRFLGGRRALWRGVRPFLETTPGSEPLRVLDVGTGGADLPLALAAAARGSGRRIEITAFDAEPTTTRIAARRVHETDGIRILRADAFRSPFRAGSFDLVTASMFLHHFRHDGVVRLLSEFRRLARRAVVINDLHRHRVPLGFIGFLARSLPGHRLFSHDAPLSVRRGFTPVELIRAAREAGADRPSLLRSWPYRLVLTFPATECS